MLSRRVLRLTSVSTAMNMIAVTAKCPALEVQVTTQRRWFRSSGLARGGNLSDIESAPGKTHGAVPPLPPSTGNVAAAVGGVLEEPLSQIGSPAASTTTDLKWGIYSMEEVEIRRVLYLPFEPWDPRASAMQALDKMVRWNLGGAGRWDRPWFCVNSGTPRSGKTTLLKLSCNHFVSSKSNALFKYADAGRSKPRARHAIYITMHGPGINHDADENDDPDTRLYRRILFAIREDRKQTWDEFLVATSARSPSAAAVVLQIRQRLPDAQVLIAADELRALTAKSTDEKLHEPAQQCIAGLSALYQLVRESCGKGVDEAAQIFVVTSVLSVVDLKIFTTGSPPPFAFQPLEPVQPSVIRDVFEKVGIDPVRRPLSDEDLQLAAGILKHSAEMELIMAIHGFEGGVAARRANVLTTIASLDKREEGRLRAYFLHVHDGGLDSPKKVSVVYYLLSSLFGRCRHGSGNESFNSSLEPALDAMCYGVCRVIRKDGCDTVLMRPDTMKKLCVVFLETPEAWRTETQTAFVTAVKEFAEALTEAALPPGKTDAATNFVARVRIVASSQSEVVALKRLASALCEQKSPKLKDFAKKLSAFIPLRVKKAESKLMQAVKLIARSRQDIADLQELIYSVSQVNDCSKQQAAVLGELSSLLSAVAVSLDAGKTFERLIKCLFRCLLLHSRHKLQLKDLFHFPLGSLWESAELVRGSVECPDVPFISAFPRAFDATSKRNEECDPRVLDLVGAAQGSAPRSTLPCVFQPTDPFNLLLGVAVIANLESGGKMCLALQCKAYTSADSAQGAGFKKAVAKWRKRSPAHLNRSSTILSEGQVTTEKVMVRFMSQVKVLWVLVTVNNPLKKSDSSSNSGTKGRDPSSTKEPHGQLTAESEEGLLKPSLEQEKPGASADEGKPFTLKVDEALLSLDSAQRWCPSLVFASSASVVCSPGEQQVLHQSDPEGPPPLFPKGPPAKEIVPPSTTTNNERRKATPASKNRGVKDRPSGKNNHTIVTAEKKSTVGKGKKYKTQSVS